MMLLGDVISHWHEIRTDDLSYHLLGDNLVMLCVVMLYGVARLSYVAMFNDLVMLSDIVASSDVVILSDIVMFEST